MSDTLAFLIDAPLQSWGVSSKFQRRETESWPTKSALVGVLAAALGIDKQSPDESEKVAPFAALAFSVFRWPKPHPSFRLTDFHTIGGGYDKADSREKLHIPRKAGDGSAFGTVITRRTYLTDARFIALFQGDRATLEAAAAALLDPVWGVWFGRKACIPAEPLSPVIASGPREALAALIKEEVADLEGLTEKAGPGSYYQSDQPIAFGQHHGPIPEAYLSRSVRRILASEL
ncbi:MAG: type I-E CRISPR-associated protein Cas5/CasD [Luteolibacter sp.]|uniref:type I-E CRISPR-associated protein Cas5/CasD n=1 Tax=Luteolibacter sp. TaxID=1962973 RepID=UPI003265EDD9